MDIFFWKKNIYLINILCFWKQKHNKESSYAFIKITKSDIDLFKLQQGGEGKQK